MYAASIILLQTLCQGQLHAMWGFILYYGFQYYGFPGISSVLLRSPKETSGQYYYGTVRGYIRQKCRNVSVLSLSFSRFVGIILSYSYLDWYKSSFLSFLCSSSPYRNFEDEIFVRWMECNTPFLEYVLRYVFWFFQHISLIYLVFIFILWLLVWLFCIGSGFVDSEVSPSLNREPDPSVFLDLAFLIVRFDRF